MSRLTTEARNPVSDRIDTLGPLEIVRLMNAEDARVAEAVGREAEPIARAIEIIAQRLRGGGRLIYIGAGTSGRLGVLDATECPPTFSTPPEMVVGLIAGGYEALTRAVEGAEDHPEFAARDLKQINFGPGDALVGIATSGRTPYVVAALAYAREIGAAAIGLACNDGSALADAADLMITPVVGPEVISGSTRLKAGTATKLVLNMLTTGAMVLLGKTYGNLMVDLKATNTKLVARTRRIVATLTGLSEAEAEAQLMRCGGELKTAVVAQRHTVTAEVARELLARAGGQLRVALEKSEIRISKLETNPKFQIANSKSEIPNPREPEFVIGVDGGGTKTVAWLALRSDDAGGTILGRGQAGPGNPRAAGFDVAQANIAAAIGAAFADANLPQAAAAAACFGLAGAGHAAEQEQIAAWAKNRGIAKQVKVTGDAEPILAAASAENFGIALICGTGSLAWGRNRDGVTARCGGWGYLLGDEGSAYAIARAALQAAVRFADGRSASTPLLDAFQRELDAQGPEQLVERIYAPQMTHERLASLAKVVFDAAGDDQVAQAIVTAAAQELAILVSVLSRRLRMTAGSFPLALGGSVILQQALLREKVLNFLVDEGAAPREVVLVAEPVRGAVAMARALHS